MHLAVRTVLSKERPKHNYVPVLDHIYVSSDLLPLLLIFGLCWQVVRSSLTDAPRAPEALPGASVRFKMCNGALVLVCLVQVWWQ